MAMTAGERQRALILVIVVVIAGGAGFWVYWRGPRVEEQRVLQAQIDSLSARVENARRDLASGTVESIRQSVQDYEAMLDRMTLLVPTGNEVTTLIDEISARAKRNGVEIAEFNPLAVEIGQSFDIYRYRWTVFGHYNQIGVLMSDIAGLSRIMVPYDVELTHADDAQRAAYADTTQSLLRAQFFLRTFVKPQAPADEGGEGGDR
jgi:type IV pilus assembly protein PilO